MDPLLLMIPVLSGLIGWGTNALAIQMLFYPVERFGARRIGWQGIIPANAERMAKTCVRLMTNRLLNIPEIFARLESHRLSEILSPPLERHAQEIVETLIARRYPTLWEATPPALREQARARLKREIPSVIDKLMTELRHDLGRYLDIQALVEGAFVKNRSLLNQLFWSCGRAEFRFIARSGLVFGAMFGTVQATVWLFVQPDWFLPLSGLVVGWATNWLALRMVFEPHEPRGWWRFKWQGLFHRRQAEVSDAYAHFFASEILTPNALVDAVMQGPAAERIVEILEKYVHQAVDQASGAAKPLLHLTMGTAAWLQIKEEIGMRLVATVPREIERIHDYAEEALALEEELRTQLRSLPAEEFEQVLRPLFQEDETTLIAVGSFLGGIAGVVQWALVAVHG